jgi:drug/metabolite transporter (DMT)-like permease
LARPGDPRNMPGMDSASLARLLVLAALWGGSFLFMRIAAPVLGPTLLIAWRVALAAVFLLGVALLRRRRRRPAGQAQRASLATNLRQHWRHYLILGASNSAIPFLLFAFAAQTLSASLLSVLNATAPIFAALIASLSRRALPAAKTTLGLVLGVAGVAVLVSADALMLQPGATVALLAALGASLSYGIASTYAKSAGHVAPFSNALGSMWAATLLIAPAVPFFPAHAAAHAGVVWSVLGLGVLCSGVAYLLYFRLIADLGAASALTVTFLIPVFGVLWGRVFLGEPVGRYTVAGALIVIAGTALVTGFSPRVLRMRRA